MCINIHRRIWLPHPLSSAWERSTSPATRSPVKPSKSLQFQAERGRRAGRNPAYPEAMAAISSLSSPHLLQRPSNAAAAHRIPLLRVAAPGSSRVCLDASVVHPLRGRRSPGRVRVVAQEASGAVQDLSSEAARRLYVGNIPRNVSNQELSSIFGEHGSVEKAEVLLPLLPHHSSFRLDLSSLRSDF